MYKVFNSNPGGVEVEMFYNPNDGDEVRHSVLSDLNTVTDETTNIPSSDGDTNYASLMPDNLGIIDDSFF